MSTVIKFLKFIIKTAFQLGFLYLCFSGLLILLFLPITKEVDLEIPQNIGGAIIIKGEEKHYDNGCNYDLRLNFIQYGTGNNVYIGQVKSSIPKHICIDMKFYNEINIIKNGNAFNITFNDGENRTIIFTSRDLKVWDSRYKT